MLLHVCCYIPFTANQHTADDIWKKYIYLSAPITFVCVSQYSGKETIDSGATYGKSKNHKPPVLNLKSVKKNATISKITEKKMSIFGFQILGCWMQGLTPYLFH